MIENIIFELYPKDTISLDIELDKHGRFLKGPMMWTMDTGQGHLENIDDEEWDE